MVKYIVLFFSKQGDLVFVNILFVLYIFLIEKDGILELHITEIIYLLIA